ncbi:hypothetical protein SDC9_77576 [bioreactor metagenome]|uniref:HEAT repeat domain-containing protein n=1 Tax=bioreactor metagenome TaxID=1076179 RepID=A0A644YX36_9ZZZZ
MKKKEEAIKELLFDSGRATADAAAELLLKKPELLADFAALAFSNEYPFDMRASNVIEKADELKHGFAAELIPDILERMKGFRNDGPKRQFLRMLIRYVKEMDEDYTGLLYDLCFGFSCSPGQSVAIRHNSLQVLARLCKRYPELKPEIAAALELRVNEESGPFGRWLREFVQSIRG